MSTVSSRVKYFRCLIASALLLGGLGTQQRFHFEEVMKQLRLPERGRVVEKAQKGGQVLVFIGLSTLMLEWFG